MTRLKTFGTNTPMPVTKRKPMYPSWEKPQLGVRLPREKMARLRRISEETGVPIQNIIEKELDKLYDRWDDDVRRNPAKPARVRIIDKLSSTSSRK